MEHYALVTCPQCRDLGIDVEYSETLVMLFSGGSYCRLCGYTTKPDGMPVVSTLLKVVKKGSTWT